MKQRSAEILCIGTELLMGDIINTNAAYLAKELAGLGINLYHQSVVGDNPERLRQSLQLALKRADIVITTGGLGPTYDDLSKETIAACFGRKLVMDEESLTRIQAHFLRLGREMTDNNKKQAMMPAGLYHLSKRKRNGARLRNRRKRRAGRQDCHHAAGSAAGDEADV